MVSTASEMGDEGDRWLDAPVRKKNKNQGKASNRNREGVISKFFITNLPHGCNTWDVADFVKVFGEVAGVFIARKYDKEGRKFGFVKFRNVPDIKEMERALNGTKMGGFKLIANLAKFAKEIEGISGMRFGSKEKDGKVSVDPQQETKTHGNAFINQGNGKLFSELFNKDPSSSSYGQKVYGSTPPDVDTVPVPNYCIEVSDETTAFNDLIGYALIGRCKDLRIMRNLNSLLMDSRIKGVSLSYLGGLTMLLKFEEEEVCNNFLLDQGVWKEWFKCLDVWNCQSLPFERIAWVRILRVPFHLADNDVLNNIAEHFGKIVYGSQMESFDRDLSVSWIGLLVGDGNRIHNQVTLKWKDKHYRVWIEEEKSEWCPDSVGPVLTPDGDVPSPELPNSGNDQNTNSPQGPDLEIQKAGENRERMEEAIDVTHGDHNSYLEPNTSCMDNVNLAAHACNSFNSEPPFSLNGTQVINNNNNSFCKDILFFNSSEPSGRPKKNASFRKPRSKAHRHGRMNSPVSEERPKKRPRDSGVFNFDLNAAPRDKYGFSVQDKGKDKEVEIRQELDSGVFREQVLEDEGFIQKC
ncbi:putative RNA recognition motif domain, nucleotide-binding alpha-beta plait domain superfamily [Helianthus debilis subsp. tardiflorus]